MRRPILLLEGKILDGRHRARACDELGTKARYEAWSGADPLAYVLSENLHRRHLTASQKAMIAAQTMEWHRAAAQARQKAGKARASREANAPPAAGTSAPPGANPLIAGKAAGTAAAAAGVSARSVERALKIQTQGTPADVREVIDGRSTLNGKAREIAGRSVSAPTAPSLDANQTSKGPTRRDAMQRAIAVVGALAELRRVDSALLPEDAERLVGELETALGRYRALLDQGVADA